MKSIERVLLVDDDDDVRLIGELSLGRVGGWEVSCASSGADAVVNAQQAAPDVILLDVMMPGMDGPSTLVRLRAVSALSSVPVIFLTAKVQKQEVRRYLELGAAGVIAKPFDPMTLPDQIRALVSRWGGE